jgi:hypothetical protein
MEWIGKGRGEGRSANKQATLLLVPFTTNESGCLHKTRNGLIRGIGTVKPRHSLNIADRGATSPNPNENFFEYLKRNNPT